MSMNNQGRQSGAGEAFPASIATISGDHGLDHEESLIFELDHGAVGVDLPDVQVGDDRLGGLRRKGKVGLPGLSEPEVVRHYVRLSRMNYAIDSGLYPLGSCTMKHNPRLNEKMARLPGFGDLHPLAPQSTTQGALELISQLMTWLTSLTGMPVRLVSQVINCEISSSAPWVVDWGAKGCRSPKPGSRAIFSFRRGLCFMVQEPSG